VQTMVSERNEMNTKLINKFGII